MESTETPPANPTEGNPEEGSPGGSGEVQSGSGSGDAQSQLAVAEERRRHFQALSDKRQVEIDRLTQERDTLSASMEERLAAIESALQNRQPVDVTEIARAVTQAQALENYRTTLASEFPGIDLEQVSGTTPEEIRGNAQAAFDARKAQMDALRQEVEADLRTKYEKQFGKLDGNADLADHGDDGGPEGGVITVERFLSMSDDETAALPADVFNKLMAEAHAL